MVPENERIGETEAKEAPDLAQTVLIFFDPGKDITNGIQSSTLQTVERPD